MADPFSFPDIAKLNRLRIEGATTSANVGVYERPLGAPIEQPRQRPMPASEAGQGASDRFFDAEEYLRRMHGR
jgi:hypothetical protein